MNIIDAFKEQYIDYYFVEHKKRRLGVDDAKKRGEIIEAKDLSRLKKLRQLEILSSQKLGAIENDLADLKVCYALTPTELKSNPICPHCHFMLDENSKNVCGMLAGSR